MQRFRAGQVVGELSGGLALAEGPVRNTSVPFPKAWGTVRVRDEFVVHRQRDGHRRFKTSDRLAKNELPDDFVARGGFRGSRDI